MKTKTLLSGVALAALLLGSPSVARADHGFGFGFGFGGRHGGFHLSIGHRGHHRHHRARFYGGHCAPAPYVHVAVHEHHWVAYYENTWVPPVCSTVFSGYDACGNPIYREVCVRAGYYSPVLRGYRCACGAYR
jgi:hypothetical protein